MSRINRECSVTLDKRWIVGCGPCGKGRGGLVNRIGGEWPKGVKGVKKSGEEGRDTEIREWRS